nr:hypothetical protein [Tanacetum cinerariifolium]
AARRRNGEVIRDPEETATPSTIIHTKAKYKDKRKGILVEEPKPLKKQAQIEQNEAYARELEAEINKNIDWDEKTKEQIKEKDSRALKMISESKEEKAAKKQKLDKEDVDIEPAKLQEVVELVTTANTARRRNGVVIRDPEETATPSTIIHTEAKYKDKRKGILVEEPKPLKKQAQIEQDEAYARELEAEINKNIDWDEVIDHVQRKEKEDNVAKRNMAGFKMDYFKGMKYDDIRPIFDKYFNSNVAFSKKTKEQIKEEDSRALKMISESKKEKAAKKQKLDEEVAELK